MSSKYLLGNDDDYRVMSQVGVKQYCYPERFPHNAIWDSAVGPDGKFYFGLASEISSSNYVRLCRYDYETNSVEELFKIEDVILPQDRAIRASKFHSSISFLPDGRIIMTTHTTDKSPRHPTWLPYAYYHHLWEGFAGGEIITYDPKTGHAENLGMPKPHESIYGSVYDPAHNALFCLGFMRGHLYRYSLDEKRVIDLGKVAEHYSFRLTLGPDGNVYGSTNTGWVFRVNTDTLKIEDLNFQFKHEPYDHAYRCNMMSIARTGPDGRLYMTSMYSRSIYALDTKTDKFEDMGWYLPTDRYSPLENRHGVHAMDFDVNGVLWYPVSSLNNYAGKPESGIPSPLFRWDIARGGKPEWCGCIGTPERGGAWMSDLYISKDNIMYAANSNHSLDGPGLIGVDLNIYEPTRADFKELLVDDYFNPHSPRYIESALMIHEQEEIAAQNPHAVQIPSLLPILLWRALAPDHIDDSAVKGLFWEDNNTLCGVCGEKNQFYFEIKDTKLSVLIPAEEADPAKVQRALDRTVPEIELHGALPHYPGRQYKAKVVAAAKMAGDRWLVGTLDGMLAIAGKDSLYNLGPAAFNGPIHALTATPDGNRVYGVGGDEDDIPVLFSYDDTDGLQWLGLTIHQFSKVSIDAKFCCTYVRSCSLSPDGKYLAIGADERMGTVVIYKV